MNKTVSAKDLRRWAIKIRDTTDELDPLRALAEDMDKQASKLEEPKRRRLSGQEQSDLFVTELLSRYSQLRSIRYTFVGNYRDLRHSTLESEHAWSSIPVRDVVTQHSPEYARRLAELSRLLHNFLAAAMSLKDHTNIVIDRVFTEVLYAPYERQVINTFAEKPVAHFVQELRNYSLHRRLLLPGTTTKAGATTLFLSKQKLLKGKKWDGASKKFLEAYEDDVPIRQFTDDYYAIVQSFHQWLDGYFYDKYARHIEAQRELDIEKIRQYIPISMQESHIRQISILFSDILVDDNWTFHDF